MRSLRVAGTSVAVYDSVSTGSVMPKDRPLLVLHSVNAVASAFEMEPFMLRQSARRRVVALDLPGFGASDKSDRRYTPALMTAAICAVLDTMPAGQVDVAALSLGCEFAAEAVLARPGRVRSLALISPTGMEDRRVGEKYRGGQTRELAWMHTLLRDSAQGGVGAALYRLLSSSPAMHAFLARMWGTRHYDRRLHSHGEQSAKAAGARHAPLDFVAGALFTRGIIEHYRALALPVWVCHGRKGAFTDFGACPDRTDTVAGGTFALQRHVFDSGAMPHFEVADAFDAAYSAFIAQFSLPVRLESPSAWVRNDLQECAMAVH